MSPENQGAFKLLKEVTYRRILTFFKAQCVAIFQPTDVQNVY